ncbi:DNA replication protein, partial [Neisseria gonorrhoeae]
MPTSKPTPARRCAVLRNARRRGMRRKKRRTTREPI